MPRISSEFVGEIERTLEGRFKKVEVNSIQFFYTEHQLKDRWSSICENSPFFKPCLRRAALRNTLNTSSQRPGDDDDNDDDNNDDDNDDG